jgi:hypothetical protein
MSSRSVTSRAGLTGVVGIHLDTHTPSDSRLVGKEVLQLGKHPLAGVPIGFLGFGRNRHHLLTCAPILPPLGTLANVGQVFYADEGMGMSLYGERRAAGGPHASCTPDSPHGSAHRASAD